MRKFRLFLAAVLLLSQTNGVLAQEAGVPAAPSVLNALVSVSTNSATLNWNDNSTNETEFKIFRRLQGGSWSQVGMTAVGINTFNDPNLPIGTYEYHVNACNASGCSTDSNIATAYATGPPASPPTAPSNIAAAVSGSNVNLAWTDNSTDETHFRLWRRTPGGPSTIVTSAVPAGTTTYTDAPGSGTWEYYVNACHSTNGCSGDSNVATATVTATAQPTAPNAPSNLTVSATGSYAYLTWTDNATNETEMKIWRRAPGGTWTNVDTFPAGPASYQSSQLAAGTYEFHVNACNSAGCSADSNTASVTIGGGGGGETTAPVAPSNLKAVKVASTVVLSWTDNSINETEFRVYQRMTGESWSQIGSVQANTFTDTYITDGNWEYRVNACNSIGCSADLTTTITISGEGGGTTPPPSGVPSSPSSLTATVSGTTVTLRWIDTATNENEFKIWRRLSGATSWTQIGSLPYGISGNYITYTDSGLTTGTHQYYVNACNNAGCSTNSNTVSATIGASQPPPTDIPSTPTNLVATVSGSNVGLSWTDNSTNESKFTIWRRMADSAVWAQTASTTVNVNYYNDQNLTPGTFEYYINACNNLGCSAGSNTVFVTVVGAPGPGTPGAPSNLTALKVAETVTLSWQDNANNETEFKVYQRDLPNGGWFQIGASLPTNSTGFVDTYIYAGSFEYRVDVCNNLGCSSSNIASITIGATPPPPNAPGAPSSLVATQTGNAVTLAWTDNATNETEFRVYQRDLPGTAWFQIGYALPAGTANFVDTVIYPGSFEYRVQACNAAGCSADSNIASITIGSGPPPPPSPEAPFAPSDLTAVQAGNTVKLSWKDNSTNEIEFKVYQRDLPNVTWFQIGSSLPADTINFIDTFIYPGTSQYRVNACGKAGCSKDSNIASITIVGTVPPPGTLSITSINPGSGPVGTTVTLTGSGFITTGNKINFGTGVITDLKSSDGKTLTFEVPDDQVPLCAVTEPRCLLPAPYNPVVPGEYKVSVTNSSGTSNVFIFSVTSVGPPPIGAFMVDKTKTSPRDGDRDLPTITRIRVKLTREFDPASTIFQFFSLAPTASPEKYVYGTFLMQSDGFEFIPSTGLLPDTKYIYKVLKTLKDKSGANLSQEFSASFTTLAGAPISGATIDGLVTDATGNPVAGAMVYVSRDDFTTYFQSTTDKDGKFKLVVPPGTYGADVWLPSMGDMVRPKMQTFTVRAGEVKRLVFKFGASAKQVSGTVAFADGRAITDAEVGAYSKESGQWASTVVDEGGRYTLKLGGGKWVLGIHPKDPGRAKWSYAGTFQEIEFARDDTSEVKTVNFVIKTPDATLTVRAQDEDGKALVGAGIMVDTEKSTFGEYEGKRRPPEFKVVDSSGKTQFNLSAGTYFVRGYLPPELGYLNPGEQLVVLTAGATRELTLTFKKQTEKSTVLLRGKTLLEDGRVVSAFVWAWSENGGFTNTRSEASGRFELRLTASDRWHVGAGTEYQDFPYKSSEILVDTKNPPAVLDLVLSKIGDKPLPPPVEVRQAATEQIVVQTNDGAKASLPPGSTGAVGTLNVKMDPVVEAPTQAAAQIVGTVYDVTVHDADGKKVDKLKEEAEIILPYDEEELKDQGISEDNLIPSFFDEGTGAWVKLDNYRIDKEKNQVICRAKHLTKFGLTTAADTTAPNAPARLKATAVGGKIKLDWQNPTADFSHAKLYRSEEAGALGKVAAAELKTGTFVDDRVLPDFTYYYTVRSVDKSNNESNNLDQVSAKVSVVSVVKVAPKKLIQLRRNLYLGLKGDDVRALQELLVKEGLLDTKFVSGRFDKNTRTAIVKFQEKYASELLKPFKLKKGTGSVGTTTRKKINKLLAQ